MPVYYVLYNPASTHAASGRRRIATLRRLVGKANVHVIETLPGGSAANQALLHSHSKQFGPKAVLCIAAGDGTVGMVIETLLLGKRLSRRARRMPILPLWGGNANDLAIMLNGSPRTSLETVLEHGPAVAIHPLSCTLVYPDKRRETRIAAAYISFGATAYAAAHLNRPHHRGNPLHLLPGGRAISEVAASINGFLEAPLFTISQAGKRRTIYERTFINGPRFAKLNLMPVALTDQAFLMRTLRHKHLGRLLSQATRLLRGRPVGRLLKKPITFTCLDPAMVQFDGEPLQLPAGTKVKIGRSKQAFYALSRRLGGKNVQYAR